MWKRPQLLTGCLQTLRRFGTKHSGKPMVEHDKFEGVTRRGSGKFSAEIRWSVGVFDTAKEAADAIQKAKSELAERRRKEADSIITLKEPRDKWENLMCVSMGVAAAWNGLPTAQVFVAGLAEDFVREDLKTFFILYGC